MFNFICNVSAVQINCIFGSYTENPKTAECFTVGVNIVATGANIDDYTGTLRPGYNVIKITVINQTMNYLPVSYSKFPELNSVFVHDSTQRFLLSTDFINLPKLNELILQFGQIADIHEDTFKNTPRLEVLRIQLQKIKTLPVGLLRGLTVLKAISFYGNQIEVLDAAFFQNNLMLNSVDFDSNRLTIIEATILDQLIVLKAVSFYNNPCIFMSSVTSSVKAVRDVINSDVCKSPSSSGIIAPLLNLDSKDTTIAKLTGFLKTCDMDINACSTCETIKSNYAVDIKKLNNQISSLEGKLNSCNSFLTKTQQKFFQCTQTLGITTKSADTCQADANSAKIKCNAALSSSSVTLQKCNDQIKMNEVNSNASADLIKRELTECYKKLNATIAFSKL